MTNRIARFYDALEEQDDDLDDCVLFPPEVESRAFLVPEREPERSPWWVWLVWIVVVASCYWPVLLFV